MKLRLIIDVPMSADWEQVTRELKRNVENKQGLSITMPDGYTFDAVLDQCLKIKQGGR